MFGVEMIEEAGKRHEHRGRSSKGILEPDRILKEIDLKGGDRLLDAGCGDGYFSIAASPMVSEEGRVYAVDSDGVAIAELKSKIVANDPYTTHVIDFFEYHPFYPFFISARSSIISTYSRTRDLLISNSDAMFSAGIPSP